jgi:hypothetical protein
MHTASRVRPREWHRLGLLAGAVLVVLQVAVLTRPLYRSQPPSGPSRSSVIVLPQSVEDRQRAKWDTLQEHESCLLLVFVSSTCPICRHMRISWYARWRIWEDSLSARVPTAWLFAESERTTREFFPDSMMIGIRRLRQIHSGDGSWNRLGVYGTPTIYLLDRQRRLRYGVVGASLPPATVTDAVCNTGSANASLGREHQLMRRL